MYTCHRQGNWSYKFGFRRAALFLKDWGECSPVFGLETSNQSNLVSVSIWVDITFYSYLFGSTSLSSGTWWVRSASLSLSSQITATSKMKNSWECRESNPGLLGERVLCLLISPQNYRRQLEFWSTCRWVSLQVGRPNGAQLGGRRFQAKIKCVSFDLKLGF